MSRRRAFLAAMTVAMLAAVPAASASTLYHDGSGMRYEADPADDLRRGEANALTVEATAEKIVDEKVDVPQQCWQFIGCLPPNQVSSYQHEAVIRDTADTITAHGEGCCLSSGMGELACDGEGGHEVRCSWTNPNPGTWLHAALGDGDDSLSTKGVGSVTAYAGAGSDTLHGTPGKDYLYGAEGDDTITGGKGEDLLAGMCEARRSPCTQDGDDVIHAADGSKDTVLCGTGHDTVITRLTDLDELNGCEVVQLQP